MIRHKNNKHRYFKKYNQLPCSFPLFSRLYPRHSSMNQTALNEYVPKASQKEWEDVVKIIPVKLAIISRLSETSSRKICICEEKDNTLKDYGESVR